MKIKDIGFTSYLRLKNYEFKTEKDNTGLVLFNFFELDESKNKNLFEEYLKSDFYKFKLTLDNNKKIITNFLKGEKIG